MAAGVEATTTAAETAATMIGTIPGTGTAEVAEEGTAARTTTIARPGTTTIGTRDRTRAPEVEVEEATTSATIRTRITGIVAHRTGSDRVRTILLREVAAGEITVPEVTAAAITIVAATEVLPVGTMTAHRPMTNATAVAEPAPVMITTRHRAAEEEQVEVNDSTTAAAAEAVEEAESVVVTSLATQWDHHARWGRRESRAVETPAR